ADQAVGLAVGNHLGHLLGAVLVPVVTAAENHSDGVGAQGLDVGQCLGLFCEPGVCMAGTTHDEVVDGGIDQTTVADVKARLGMGGQRVDQHRAKKRKHRPHSNQNSFEHRVFLCQVVRRPADLYHLSA